VEPPVPVEPPAPELLLPVVALDVGLAVPELELETLPVELARLVAEEEVPVLDDPQPAARMEPVRHETATTIARFRMRRLLCRVPQGAK
jgi:hypothetical protein